MRNRQGEKRATRATRLEKCPRGIAGQGQNQPRRRQTTSHTRDERIPADNPATFLNQPDHLNIDAVTIDKTDKETSSEVIRQLRSQQEALRQAEEQYRHLVESASSVILRSDRDLNITFMNRYGLEYFGYAAEEIIGRNALGTIIPVTDGTGADLEAMAKDLMRHPDQYKTNVHQNRRKDGTLVWMSWANRAIYDDQGNLVEILAIGNDLSKLKEAEEALRQYEQAAKTGKAVHFEEYYAPFDSWFDVHAYPNPDGMSVYYRNVTESRNAAQALRESEERLRRVASAGRIGFYEWSSQTDSAYWSPEAYELFGRKPGDPTGFQGWIACLHPEDRERAARNQAHMMEHARAAERCVRLRDEYRTMHDDGVVLWLEATTEFDPDGDAMVIRGAVRDITDRKRMENELVRSRARLEITVEERTRELSQTVLALQERSEQLRRMTAQLTLAEQRERQRLAQVLHDGLQQILVGAKFRLALLEKNPDAQNEANQVVELIDDAIETSRSLTAELCPPILLQGDFVSALEWLARWMHDKHELEVSLTAREKVGPLMEDTTLLLFQAARELLFNVVKHAGVNTARVELSRSDGQVSMIVEDEGIGFDPDQLHAEGRPSEGIGLFGIGERLSYIGGRMEIRSAPGRGSRFKLTAPVQSGPADADQSLVEAPVTVSVAFSSQPETGSAAGAGVRIRIVLVDDHMVMRQGLAALLRNEPDFEIAGEASDGQAAISLIRRIRPDVVLMDISMPGMDGIQATQEIHKELPDVRVIGLSMFQEKKQERAMREAGAVAYLTKSGPFDALIAAIRAKNKTATAG